MANKITIDLTVWTTQQQYSRETGIKLNTISQWVKRTKEGKGNKTVEILEIPELNNLVLIKR
jgi:transposase-like protein